MYSFESIDYIVQLKVWGIKGISGCFFTRTSLLKSSNNLEPICNDVNIKYS